MSIILLLRKFHISQQLSSWAEDVTAQYNYYYGLLVTGGERWVVSKLNTCNLHWAIIPEENVSSLKISAEGKNFVGYKISLHAEMSVIEKTKADQLVNMNNDTHSY